MKLQVSNANQPNWRTITISAEIPAKLKALEIMSKNLWWVWNSKGKCLFRDLDPDLWRKLGENPVMLLQPHIRVCEHGMMRGPLPLPNSFSPPPVSGRRKTISLKPNADTEKICRSGGKWLENSIFVLI